MTPTPSKSPVTAQSKSDEISVELIQKGTLVPREPWASMPNTGKW